jgi:serine/threonine-protein kinase
LHPGDLISGKYRLLRLLGSGGMGSVWAARNELTDRDFAIKFLLPKLAEDNGARNRIFLEARACGQIKHPAVVDVYDMGQADDGSPYIVMELLEGEGFDQRLARAGVFRPADAAAWIAFIARGLEEAHVRGLIHRDLKPGNIFFALDDRGDVLPKLLDFGVSKAIGIKNNDFVKTVTGAVLGSPSYMSPEQAAGNPDIDGRSDVWSLGVILYEALTGKLPFEGINYNALMVAIITKPHSRLVEVAPGIPAELSAIVDHALAKKHSDRIGTARELAERLEAVANKLGGGQDLPRLRPRVPSVMPGPPTLEVKGTETWRASRLQRILRARSKAARWAVGGAAVALLALGSFALIGLQPPRVPLAGRVTMVIVTRIGELRRQFDRLKAEERLEQEGAVATAAKPVVPPSEVRSARKRVARPAGAARRSAGKGGVDPHDGVDSAGF